MYKSSPKTFLFKYIFPVLLLLFGIPSIVVSWKNSTPESIGFAKSMIVALTWVSIFIVQMPFRLKNITAGENGITFREKGKDIQVHYRDIAWITKFDITSPWFITIKYHIQATGENKRISFIPEKNNQKFFALDEMSEFIKGKIDSVRMGHSNDPQPSAAKNFLLLMLLAFPFFALMLYFNW